MNIFKRKNKPDVTVDTNQLKETNVVQSETELTEEQEIALLKKICHIMDVADFLVIVNVMS